MGIVPGKIFEKEDWKKKLSINFITVLFFLFHMHMLSGITFIFCCIWLNKFTVVILLTFNNQTSLLFLWLNIVKLNCMCSPWC